MWGSKLSHGNVFLTQVCRDTFVVRVSCIFFLWSICCSLADVNCVLASSRLVSKPVSGKMWKKLDEIPRSWWFIWIQTCKGKTRRARVKTASQQGLLWICWCLSDPIVSRTQVLESWLWILIHTFTPKVFIFLPDENCVFAFGKISHKLCLWEMVNERWEDTHTQSSMIYLNNGMHTKGKLDGQGLKLRASKACPGHGSVIAFQLCLTRVLESL